MVVLTKTVQIKSKGENDMIDITQEAAALISEANLKNGIVTVFVTGSTAAVTTIEYEPGLKRDFPNMLSRIAP
ncbi:MAG: YjbQ family protein, partial [Nitrososphaeraceae archaeon]